MLETLGGSSKRWEKICTILTNLSFEYMHAYVLTLEEPTGVNFPTYPTQTYNLLYKIQVIFNVYSVANKTIHQLLKNLSSFSIKLTQER